VGRKFQQICQGWLGNFGWTFSRPGEVTTRAIQLRLSPMFTTRSKAGSLPAPQQHDSEFKSAPLPFLPRTQPFASSVDAVLECAYNRHVSDEWHYPRHAEGSRTGSCVREQPIQHPATKAERKPCSHPWQRDVGNFDTVSKPTKAE
jgi:hypothetical protein